MSAKEDAAQSQPPAGAVNDPHRSLILLRRRLALGLFLEIWPRWATGGLFVAGVAVVICRLLFIEAAHLLPWLWLAPLTAVVPAAVQYLRRAYRPHEVAALADSLAGGRGLLLSVIETGDQHWRAAVPPPRLRLLLRRPLAPLLSSAVFLFVALLLPQHRPQAASGAPAMAQEIASELQHKINELKKDDLVTPQEQKKLEEEVERLRLAAAQRFDASSWEAADALREKMTASLSEKRDALAWAQESLQRLNQALQAASGAVGAEEASRSSLTDATAELGKALEKLSQCGLFEGAPEELQKLLGGKQALADGRMHLPTDPESLRRLSEMVAAHAVKRGKQYAGVAQFAKDPGRLDLTEYPSEFDPNPGRDGDGEPGRGGVNRGRGDADLTWGRESLPADRFKAQALPTGSYRSPDDWAPVAVLPSAPKTAPERGGSGTAVQFADTAGQTAWRRTLAPLHRSVVRHYFQGTETKP